MNYYNEIKKELINNEISRKVKNYSINRSDLETYYNVGKMLIEAQGGSIRAKYGDNLIKKYADKLVLEVDKKYNSTNLKRMRQFYLLIEKGAPMGHQLTWSHYRQLLVFKDINIVNYYIDQVIRRNLSKRQLETIIKNKEYERLPIETKNKLVNKKESNVIDFVKNPILIKSNNEIVSEKVLQKVILEDIESFLKELGNSFCFIGSEYKIKLNNSYNYIDILLYNIEHRCYVVVELKVTSLKKEHIGQIEVYMNYIDKNIKRFDENKTVGIIICKKDDNYIIEYSSDERIIARTYEVV